MAKKRKRIVKMGWREFRIEHWNHVGLRHLPRKQRRKELRDWLQRDHPTKVVAQ